MHWRKWLVETPLNSLLSGRNSEAWSISLPRGWRLIKYQSAVIQVRSPRQNVILLSKHSNGVTCMFSPGQSLLVARASRSMQRAQAYFLIDIGPLQKTYRLKIVSTASDKRTQSTSST